jgi:poxvirus D5 protein-like
MRIATQNAAKSMKANTDLMSVQNYLAKLSPKNVSSFEELYDYIIECFDDYYTQKFLDEQTRLIIANKNNIEPKIKISEAETVTLIQALIPLACITPASASGQFVKNTAYNFYMYDFDHSSDTFGTYIHASEFITKVLMAVNLANTQTFFKRTFELLIDLTKTITEFEDPNYIFVNNGIYNKTTNELLPFDPGYVSLSKIKTDYNVLATSPTIMNPDDGTVWTLDQWLSELVDNDPDRIKQLWQIISAALNPGRVYDKCVIFHSTVGNNGKGTLGQLIKNVIGGRNLYAALPIVGFSDRFRVAQLVGKICNIGDENPVGQYLDSIAQFKAAITGDDIQIEYKGRDAYPLQVRLLNIQMMNSSLLTKDKSESAYRRFLIVPFTHSFTGIERKYIKHDYMNRQEVKEYVLKKALEMPVVTDFIVTPENNAALYAQKVENNSVYEFMEDVYVDLQWSVLPIKFLYDLYVEWSSKYNLNGKPIKKSIFVDYVTNYLNERNDDAWEARTQQSEAISVGTSMDNDEPLITTYNLTSYFNTNYKGSDPKLKRAFKRPKTTRGWRKT